jgi:hypothetical protein
MSSCLERKLPCAETRKEQSTLNQNFVLAAVAVAQGSLALGPSQQGCCSLLLGISPSSPTKADNSCLSCCSSKLELASLSAVLWGKPYCPRANARRVEEIKCRIFRSRSHKES